MSPGKGWATLYAGTFGDGVFKSTNPGGTWAAANTGLTYRFVNALAIDPSALGALYAGTNGGVWQLTPLSTDLIFANGFE